jgi:hypothetical protein
MATLFLRVQGRIFINGLPRDARFNGPYFRDELLACVPIFSCTLGLMTSQVLLFLWTMRAPTWRCHLETYSLLACSAIFRSRHIPWTSGNATFSLRLSRGPIARRLIHDAAHTSSRD